MVIRTEQRLPMALSVLIVLVVICALPTNSIPSSSATGVVGAGAPYDDPPPQSPSESYTSSESYGPPPEPERQNRKKPNVVILFADNLGYNDVGAFAAAIDSDSDSDPSSEGGTRHGGGDDDSSPPAPSSSDTPHLDALASRSLLLRQWTSPAVLCSASRAALLTGRYPVRLGVYPRVFTPDAASGLPPDEVTLAELLRETDADGNGGGGYATKIVGKWHLGHREGYRPTDRGFDEWFGIPYHMSAGSLDGHVCGDDVNETRWLPLFRDDIIEEQPVNLTDLAERYAAEATSFVEANAQAGRPFFLYAPFSHVHQLCAPRHDECQWSGPSRPYRPPPPSSRGGVGSGGEEDAASSSSPGGDTPNSPYTSDFGGAVREMDWIAGRILDSLKSNGVEDDTLVIFTADNGPWIAEGSGSCAGTKGPFEGRWLKDNVDEKCTACPSMFVHDPTEGRPRRCRYVRPTPPPASSSGGGVREEDEREETVDGIHCGEDSGLGSAWEANNRVPALVSWPNGGVPRGAVSDDLISTLDVLPTVLSMVAGAEAIPENVDGADVSDVWRGRNGSAGGGRNRRPRPRTNGKEEKEEVVDDDDGEREHPPIFYWRDGFSSGPLPPPYGRFDVAAVRFGNIKAWFYTKSAHYNADPEVYHDPPLLFDVVDDPAESRSLDLTVYADEARRAVKLVQEHKAAVDWRGPLTLQRDSKYLPCADRENGCRTKPRKSDVNSGTAEKSRAEAVA